MSEQHTGPNRTTGPDQTGPSDLIPLSEACKRGPRPARGKRRHRSTVLRWILGGKIRGWRVLGNWFVSAGELEALLRPEPATIPLAGVVQQRIEQTERERQTDEVLRAAGVRR
jgi:hypothetical protein